MPKANVKILGLDRAKRLIARIGSRLRNPAPAMDAFGNLTVSSALRRFDEGA